MASAIRRELRTARKDATALGHAIRFAPEPDIFLDRNYRGTCRLCRAWVDVFQEGTYTSRVGAAVVFGCRMLRRLVEEGVINDDDVTHYGEPYNSLSE